MLIMSPKRPVAGWTLVSPIQGFSRDSIENDGCVIVRLLVTSSLLVCVFLYACADDVWLLLI